MAGQESGSHTKRRVECVRRIGHRPRKTKESNCAHSSVSLLDTFTQHTHTQRNPRRIEFEIPPVKESIEKQKSDFRSGYQDSCVFEFIPKFLRTSRCRKSNKQIVALSVRRNNKQHNQEKNIGETTTHKRPLEGTPKHPRNTTASKQKLGP